MAGVNALAHIIQLAGLIAILLGAGFCVAAGDRPIFAAAIFYLIATAGSLAVQAWPPIMPYGVMAIDGFYFLILFGIAMRWRRQWTLWATALQSLSLFTHAAWLAHSVPRTQYLTLLALWSYLVMVALCVGAGMAWQRRRSLRIPEQASMDQGSVSKQAKPLAAAPLHAPPSFEDECGNADARSVGVPRFSDRREV